MKCFICKSYITIISETNINNFVDVYERHCDRCDKTYTYFGVLYDYDIEIRHPNTDFFKSNVIKDLKYGTLYRIMVVKAVINYLIKKTGCPSCCCILSNLSNFIGPIDVIKNRKISSILKEITQ